MCFMLHTILLEMWCMTLSLWIIFLHFTFFTWTEQPSIDEPTNLQRDVYIILIHIASVFLYFLWIGNGFYISTLCRLPLFFWWHLAHKALNSFVYLKKKKEKLTEKRSFSIFLWITWDHLKSSKFPWR